tara:strand:+ start:10 stop:441 length:432 start_codon:yes stop_codon:yes gene_type:complete
MKLLMNEVLQKVSNAKTKKEKINLLRELNTQALRSLLIINFDESIISMLPDGAVPYTPNEAPEGTEHTVLEKEQRILYHFFKGGSKISQAKREQMFVGLLEGLTSAEAEVLVLAKDKKIGKRYKITKATVTEAFPQIVWGNRS